MMLAAKNDPNKLSFGISTILESTAGEEEKKESENAENTDENVEDADSCESMARNEDDDDQDDDDDDYELDGDDHIDNVDGQDDESTLSSGAKQKNVDQKKTNEIKQSTSDLSAQYKNLHDYYLSLCRSQLMPTANSSLKSYGSVGAETDTTNSCVDHHYNSELSSSLFKFLLASSSSNTTTTPTASSSTIYNSILMHWLSSQAASLQQNPNLELTRSLLASPLPPQPPPPPSMTSSSSSQPSVDAGLLIEQKAQNYQKRIGHPYQNRNPPKRKKPRTSFNRPQIVELEKRFMKQKYLASSERSSLAKLLKMTDAQVKTWFQNRRTKWRRQNAEEKEAERQATNKLLMTLKQQQQLQQHNQKPTIDVVSSSLSSSSSSSSSDLDNRQLNQPTSHIVVDPLNKLMMMEKVVFAATSEAVHKSNIH